MDENDWLAHRFEEQRGRLRGVAYRMLGSATEADDAVQEAWLRLSRADHESVENLEAWLTTVVARVCLNILRSRRTRREEPLETAVVGGDPMSGGGPMAGGNDRDADPEQEAVLADSVGIALLVVLDRLTPAERLAFVLHDMFDIPFDEVGPIVGRSPGAARQLASRARRRVRGAAPPEVDVARQRRVVDAYLAATRAGDFDALVEVLDPDVVLHADAAAGPAPAPLLLRGAESVARGAVASAVRARFTEPALVNGSVGLVMARGAHLSVVLTFTVVADRITEIDVIGEPERLRRLEVAVIDDSAVSRPPR